MPRIIRYKDKGHGGEQSTSGGGGAGAGSLLKKVAGAVYGAGASDYAGTAGNAVTAGEADTTNALMDSKMAAQSDAGLFDSTSPSYSTGGVDGQTGSPYATRITATPSSVPVTSAIKAPGVISNLLTEGQAGLQYQQYLYNQNLQNTLGQQQMGLEQLRGANTIANTQETGAQGRLTSAQMHKEALEGATHAATINYMHENKIAPDDYAAYNAIKNQVRPFVVAGATSAAQGQANIANVQANANDPFQNPNVQPAANLGATASMMTPYLQGQALAPETGIGGYRSINMGPLGNVGVRGALPNSTTQENSIVGPDGKVLSRNRTTTATGYKPSGGGFQQPIDQSELDSALYNKGTAGISATPGGNLPSWFPQQQPSGQMPSTQGNTLNPAMPSLGGIRTIPGGGIDMSNMFNNSAAESPQRLVAPQQQLSPVELMQQAQKAELLRRQQAAQQVDPSVMQNFQNSLGY